MSEEEAKTVAPDTKEDWQSQLPALHLLFNLGFTYLSPQKALEMRGVRNSNVIVEGLITPQLRKMT